MIEKSISLKYYSKKMLLTLDLNKLMLLLIEAYGESFSLKIEKMNEGEKREASSIVNDLVKVKDRMFLIDGYETQHPKRRTDIELRVVAEGRK